MMGNPFLDLAERQTSAPVKARRRAAEKRVAAKALDERDTQVKVWCAWRCERRDALLAGPHGADAQALLNFIWTMTLASAAALVDAVGRGPWHQADSDTRFEVLSIVDAAIIALRERQGLPPFDDALPGEASNAFLLVREALSQ
jgi:hypothetical protein